MSCVYEVMSDCGRASSDSMAKAQKSRDLYKSLLRNRTSPTKIVQEKRRVVVRRKPKSAGLSSCETKLSNLLDSKAKLMLPMTHTYFNNQTPVPIPGQRAGVSCRTGDVPRLVVRRTYSSDALRTQQRELENTQQLHQSNSREQGSIQDASLPSDDMDSLDKLNFQEGWKNDKEKSVSSGPNFVQVSVPRTPTTSLVEGAPDSSNASLGESSEDSSSFNSFHSHHPVLPVHRTSSPFIDEVSPQKSPTRVVFHRDTTCSYGGLSCGRALLQSEPKPRYRVGRKTVQNISQNQMKLGAKLPPSVRVAVNLKVEKEAKDSRTGKDTSPLFTLCIVPTKNNR